jgi:hypothetical protein
MFVIVRSNVELFGLLLRGSGSDGGEEREKKNERLQNGIHGCL